MNTNPWAASDIHHLTKATRLDWLWTVLYGQILDMAATLPTPVRLAPLDNNATEADRANAAARVERLRDTDLYRQDLPADIRELADRAITSAVLTVHPGDSAERRELITEAQARVRAVIAYMGVGPEDLGVHDTWEETTLLDR